MTLFAFILAVLCAQLEQSSYCLLCCNFVVGQYLFSGMLTAQVDNSGHSLRLDLHQHQHASS